MKNITVVFPMAGEGQRFGGKFKPFLKIFDKTFIELAVQPFLKHSNFIKEIIFIVRNDHYDQFNVNNRIKALNIPIPTLVQGIEPTNSPVETIATMFGDRKELHDVIFCDCDHSLNVDKMFDSILEDGLDCIIPLWDIKREEASKWSIVEVDLGGWVNKIAEKKFPSDSELCFGVIGCYYFSNLLKPSNDLKYISDIISHMVENKKAVIGIHIKEAEFFGDPERLNNLYAEKKASTIFCDLDGTIIKHEGQPSYSSIELLEGAGEKIKHWRDNNCFIVLTTSRDEQFRPEMERLLRQAGISYEHLIMGLPPGTRHLINDKKPYSEATMAKAHEVTRDIGIGSLNLGHSYAELSRDNGMIKKSIPLDSSDYQKEKFRAQYVSMNSISFTDYKRCVPEVGCFEEYSYYIQELVGWKGLHLLSDEQRSEVLRGVLQCLKGMYSDLPITENWLEDFLQEKIYSKKEVIHSLGLGDKCDKVFELLRNCDLSAVAPKKMTSWFHGDLTYENILSDGRLFKFIDFDNDNKSGVAEMDLGKLMQSFLTKYEFWGEGTVLYPHDDFELVVNGFCEILNEQYHVVARKAHFYCALHLFRMIPYQAKSGIERPTWAIDFCLKHLDYAFENTKLEHFYEPITGWFTFPRFYSDMVNKLPSGGSVVEVGVYEGKSLAYFMVEMLNTNKRFNVYAVDSFTFNDEQTKENIEVVFMRNLASVIDTVHVIKGDSGLSANHFQDESLDLVFLDADHVKERVYSDIMAWLPKIKKGGIIAGHDYCLEHVGVVISVNEIFGDNWQKDYLDELVWYYIKK